MENNGRREPDPGDLDAAEDYFGALTTGAVLNLPFARQLAFKRTPLTKAMTERTREAVGQALTAALEAGGNVVRVSCNTDTEAMLASYLLGGVCCMLKDVKLLEEQSTTTRFELSNNSCILVVLGRR